MPFPRRTQRLALGREPGAPKPLAARHLRIVPVATSPMAGDAAATDGGGLLRPVFLLKNGRGPLSSALLWAEVCAIISSPL